MLDISTRVSYWIRPARPPRVKASVAPEPVDVVIASVDDAVLVNPEPGVVIVTAVITPEPLVVIVAAALTDPPETLTVSVFA